MLLHPRADSRSRVCKVVRKRNKNIGESPACPGPPRPLPRARARGDLRTPAGNARIGGHQPVTVRRECSSYTHNVDRAGHARHQARALGSPVHAEKVHRRADRQMLRQALCVYPSPQKRL